MFGLDIIKKLKPASFKYKQDKNLPCNHLQGNVYFGLIAQDIEKDFPYKEYPFLIKDYTGYYKVAYDQFIPVLIKSTQELHNKIEYLENRIKYLENEINNKK